MTLDNFIRTALKKAAEDITMTNEQKVELLIRVLTVFLTKHLRE